MRIADRDRVRLSPAGRDVRPNTTSELEPDRIGTVVDFSRDGTSVWVVWDGRPLGPE